MLLTKADQIILPDIVNGSLPSRFLSVSISNSGTSWIRVTDAKIYQEISEYAVIVHSKSVIAPGQNAAIALEIGCREVPANTGLSLNLTIEFVGNGDMIQTSTMTTNHLVFECKQWGEAFKFTWIDYDGSVHYGGCLCS